MPTIYLIPSILAENATDTIPQYVKEAIRDCGIFFVENERTTRRYFKLLWKEMIIDNYEWYVIGKDTDAIFREKLKGQQNIGIVSEAGSPGVADPGQELVSIAQQENAIIKPLTGPSSILLALMASGMNGQQFQFCGYLPIDAQQRIKTITELENESRKKNCTQVFIETPYRNNQLIDVILKTCSPQTRLCIAVDITGSNESIKTKTIAEWRKGIPDIHKRPAIFLIYSGN